MKKVININFQGRVIPIEESAYEILKNYTDSLRRYFANEEGRDEIINDIENRWYVDPIGGLGYPAYTVDRLGWAQHEILPGDILCVRTGWMGWFLGLGAEQRAAVSAGSTRVSASRAIATLPATPALRREEIKIQVAFANALALTGDLVDGKEHYDRALAIYDPVEHRSLTTRSGRDVGVALLSSRSGGRCMLGNPAAARDDSERAVRNAHDLGQSQFVDFPGRQRRRCLLRDQCLVIPGAAGQRRCAEILARSEVHRARRAWELPAEFLHGLQPATP